jgi:hypothetical protein
MLWAGIGFSCYASSHVHYFRGRPFSSTHAWLRARAGAFATKNIELLSHFNSAKSFDRRIVGIGALDPHDHGIKSRLRDTLKSPNAGDQIILIPLLWPSRQFDPRRVVKVLDPQDHGTKSGLRDFLILQCWGSKHSDPASVAFASF